MRSRGHLFWKQEWYSICSMHHDYKEDCHICNAGTWENIILIKISGWFHDHFYKLWFWYVNLPINIIRVKNKLNK